MTFPYDPDPHGYADGGEAPMGPSPFRRDLVHVCPILAISGEANEPL